MADISKINVNSTTYNLKDSRLPDLNSSTTQYLRGDGTWATPTVQTMSGNVDVSDEGTYMLISPLSGGGSGGLVYETGTYTPTSDIAQQTISFQNSHTTKPFCVMISDISNVAQSTNSSEMCWTYLSFYEAFGVPFKVGSTSYYARRQGSYKPSNSSVNGTGGNDTSDSTAYVSSSGFAPSNSASYYWRSGTTYKWIAVWVPTA